MPLKFVVIVTLCGFVVSGCQQSPPDSAPPEAEVPLPGPAIEDPGPAPGGQTEPPVEEATAPEVPASSDGVSGENGGDQTEDTAAAGDSEDGSVSLKLQEWDATQALIDSHQGKIVVVDFWATSCLPCRREFPHLVALQNAHPDDVACVSVSLDYSGRKSRPPESYRESVQKFLNEQNAEIDNVLSIDDPDQLEQQLDLAPIPLVWVFDRSGERRRTFDNADLEGEEFTYEGDVVPFVAALLAEK